MRYYFILSVFVFSACVSSSKQFEVSDKEDFYDFQYVNNTEVNESCVQGNFYNENGEPLAFANVLVYDSALSLKAGSYTDEFGAYKMCFDYEGQAKLKVNFAGYVSQEVSVVLKKGKSLSFSDTIRYIEPKIELLKPVIYLYPQKSMEVHVELDIDNKELKHCYPKYKNGWKMKVKKDGTLYDEDGRSYYALFWESETYKDMSFTSANLVSKKDLIPFLETSLSTLGLTEREANEFIMFWLPRLEQNEYNLIHFSTDDYSAKIPLNVSPEPDQQIRVMMLYSRANKNTLFPLQILKKIDRKENAFVLVEWGGAFIPHPLKNTNVGEGKASIFKKM